MALMKYNKDAIINEIKRIIKSTEIKYQREADKYETVESAKAADIYINAVYKADSMLSYPKLDRRALIRAGVVDTELLNKYLDDRYQVPQDLVPRVIEEQRKIILSSYIEKNNYYRTRIGLPPLDKEGNEIDVIVLTDDECNAISVPLASKIHQLSKVEEIELEAAAILEKYKTMYPNYKYLNYLAHNKLDLVAIRKARNFEIIYHVMNNSMENFNMTFLSVYTECREYMMEVIYNRHTSFSFTYYEEFMALMIMMMTIQRMFTKLFEMGIERDFFDLDSIQGMFDTYRVPFLENMNFDSKRAIMKNFNKLLRHKSTDVVLYDILSLLGFNNMKVYELYLTKEHILKDDGTPLFLYKDVALDPNHPDQLTRVLDVENMFTFYFHAVDKKDPNVLLAMTQSINTRSYEEITLPDSDWIEDANLREYLLNEEFNFVKTKYIDMNIMYKLTKMIFEATTLFKMITDKKKEMEVISLYLPKILGETRVPIFDAIVLAMALIAKMKSMKGNIIWEPSKVMAVMGYNFEADFNKIRQDILSNPHIVDKSIVDFIPRMNIREPKDINTLFNNIKEFEKYIVDKMNYTKTIEEYRAYHNIYRTLMISQYNYKIFTKTDGTVAKTFREYLVDVNIEYGNIIDNADETLLSSYLDHIIFNLTKIVNGARYLYILNEATSSIMATVIDLVRRFKSLTTKINNLNVTYVLDSKYYNMIVAKDQIRILSKIVEYDERLMGYYDFLEHLAKYRYMKDMIEVYERYVLQLSYTLASKVTHKDSVRLKKEAYLLERYHEYCKSLISSIEKTFFQKIDASVFWNLEKYTLYKFKDTIPLKDQLLHRIMYKYFEEINKMYRETYRYISDFLIKEPVDYKEKVYINAFDRYNDRIENITDKISIENTYKIIESLKLMTTKMITYIKSEMKFEDIAFNDDLLWDLTVDHYAIQDIYPLEKIRSSANMGFFYSITEYGDGHRIMKERRYKDKTSMSETLTIIRNEA